MSLAECAAAAHAIAASVRRPAAGAALDVRRFGGKGGHSLAVLSWDVPSCEAVGTSPACAALSSLRGSALLAALCTCRARRTPNNRRAPRGVTARPHTVPLACCRRARPASAAAARLQVRWSRLQREPCLGDPSQQWASGWRRAPPRRCCCCCCCWQLVASPWPWPWPWTWTCPARCPPFARSSSVLGAPQAREAASHSRRRCSKVLVTTDHGRGVSR